MFTLLGPSVAALALGLLARGSLGGIGRTIVGWPVVVLAIVAELLLQKNFYPESTWLATWGHWMWAASLAAMLPVLLLNARRSAGLGRLAWLVAMLGLTFNLSVILTNGGYMPVDPNAVDETHQTAWFNNPLRFRRDVAIGTNTHLAFLSDVLPEPAWLPDRKIMSIGDILISSGLATWVLWAVRTRPDNMLSPQNRHAEDVLNADSSPQPA